MKILSITYARVDTSILLAEEEAPYARHDHNEGTIVKRTIVNSPLVELLCLVIFSVNIIRFLMQLLIYYAIKMISYAHK